MKPMAVISESRKREQDQILFLDVAGGQEVPTTHTSGRAAKFIVMGANYDWISKCLKRK